MIASELISETVPAINKNDKASEALNWMDVFKIIHLPIVDNDEYLGLISEYDIFDLNNTDIPVIKHPLTLSKPFVRLNDHIFNIVGVVSKHKLTTIPVLDDNDKYIGLITIHDLAQEFTHLMSVESPGGIVVLEVKMNDYSLSEIARIVEENNSKIFSLYIQTIKKTDKFNVTIKINKIDISSVIKTFERYNYKIIATYSEENKLDSSTQDRIDSFLKYLNI